jgi:CubicO group peptidase (beta-lactamase class C family)
MPQAIADLSPELDQAIASVLRRHGVPGAAVAAVRDGTTFASAYGVRHLGQEAPVTLQTAFNIGSTSKAVCAAAIAVLATEGALAWDDPVQRFLPEFAFGGPGIAPQVTLRDLSANRVGLPRTGIIEFGSDLAIDAAELVRRTRYVDPVAPLRARFTYSNIGHVAVALAAARAAGCDYHQLLENRIFRPLDMHHTATGTAARTAITEHAGWHCAVDGQTVALAPVFTDVQMGAAGVCMSAADASRWLSFLLSDGAPIIPAAALAELFAPHVPVTPDQLAIWIAPPGATDAAYALGWAVARQDGRRILRHSGSDFGMNAHISLAPDDGFGAAVFVNKDCKASVEINYLLMDALAGLAPRDWSHAVSDPSLPDTNASFLQAGRGDALPAPVVDQRVYLGSYFNPANGAAEIMAGPQGLEIRFANAPLFYADLHPAGANVFTLVPRYAGLVSDSVGARFRATAEMEDGRAQAFDIRGIGRFVRSGQAP